jgi:cytochrome b
MILRDHSIIIHIQFGFNSEGKILFFPIWSYVETLSCGGGWLSKEQILSSNNSITHVVLGTIFEISANQKANLA